MNNELTPYIEYHDNGNVFAKGQENSKGQREGIWELFYSNGNIEIRTSYVEGKRDGIAECFYAAGNIESRTSYKEDKEDGIEEWFDKQGNITLTYLWRRGNNCRN